MRIFKIISFMIALMTLTIQGVGATEVISVVGTSKERIKKISQVIKREPTNSQAYAERASVKFEAKDAFGAIRDYSSAISLSAEKNTKYLLGRGNAFLEIGAFKEALKDFNEALSTTSTAELLYGRAVAAYFLDDYFGALRDLDQVIAADPTHPKALYNRAVVKMELNQLDGAAEDLTNFLALYPDPAAAERAIAAADAIMQK